jgi:hypothetical protein
VKPLDVTNLAIECDADGSAKVTAWCKCRSPDDIDDVIEWLKLAKTFMEKWQQIRSEEPK